MSMGLWWTGFPILDSSFFNLKALQLKIQAIKPANEQRNKSYLTGFKLHIIIAMRPLEINKIVHECIVLPLVLTAVKKTSHNICMYTQDSIYVPKTKSEF